jgi:hypothetical protein
MTSFFCLRLAINCYSHRKLGRFSVAFRLWLASNPIVVASVGAYQLLEVFKLETTLSIKLHATFLDISFGQYSLERLEKVLDMF